MSESAIADFVGKFNSDTLTRGEPVTGRVILSKKRLVLAANSENKLTIPLSSIFDVAVGHVPDELSGFFQSTVTVAFRRRNQRYVAAIEAADDTIERFSRLLFKALLNGTEMTIKHPARLGGRVTDEKFVPASLFLKPRRVQFKNDSEAIEIELSSVTEFSRSNREVAGVTRPILEFRHMQNGQSMLTMAATESGRKMALIGRYLRLEYSELVSELKDIDLSTDEKEVLVAIYSGAGGEGMGLHRVMDTEPSQLTILLNRLEEDELVVDSESGTSLTPKGQVIVSKHLEDVNA